MFLHGSLLHLGGNMLFLWIFGNNIEDSMSRFRFALFYVLGGVAALGLQVVTDPDAAIPTVGASGAIAAVLGGYALLYPRARVVTLVFIVIIFTVIRLPALLVLGFWFLLQVLPAVSTEPVGEGGGGGRRRDGGGRGRDGGGRGRDGGGRGRDERGDPRGRPGDEWREPPVRPDL
jgi:uncharacterized membrane protein YgcG